MEKIVKKCVDTFHLDPTVIVDRRQSAEGQYYDLEQMLLRHQRLLKSEIKESLVLFSLCVILSGYAVLRLEANYGSIVLGISFLLALFKATQYLHERIQFHFITSELLSTGNQTISELHDYIDETSDGFDDLGDLFED